ncbi:hypothetical protein PVL29_002479 [Vitis rotundifolia]|uniref:Uncharacterized protein n=1 Tax=Vitis rotundifolia TaxID=103349 RepID=A0AA39AHS7_VITRO|nr:hypothetical protein PVL29_002479 [Vitis rotundifolia]
MDSCIDAHLSKMETRMDDLTFSIQQLTSLVDGGTEVIGSRFDTRAQTIAHVDGEIFIRGTNTGVDIIIRDDPPMVQDVGEAVTPIVEITYQAATLMLEDIAQVSTPVLEEIDGVVDPIIGD